nr:hypothetical protein [Clostridia bacterium]
MKINLNAVAGKCCEFVNFINKRRDEYNAGDPIVFSVSGNAKLDVARKSDMNAKMVDNSKKLDFKITLYDLTVFMTLMSILLPLVNALWSVADRIVRKLW